MITYKCYSCADKVKKAGFGDKLKNAALGYAKFSIGNIPFIGDNIVDAVPALKNFEAQTDFGRKMSKAGDFINSTVQKAAPMVTNMFAPGVGTALGVADNALDSAQNNKNSSKSLGIINPRYAQTGGNVKHVPGGKLKQLSSTGIAAEGKSHAQGGIALTDKVEIENKEGVHKIDKDIVISSNSLQDPDNGYTFAEQMKELERMKGKLEMQLKDNESKPDSKSGNTVIVLKKKIDEISEKIKLLYGKQELIAMQKGLRDKQGNPNQLSQDIVPGPDKQTSAQYGGMTNIYPDMGRQSYKQSEIDSGINAYKKPSKLDMANNIMDGIVGGIAPLLGGVVGGGNAGSMVNTAGGTENMFKGLGKVGMFEKGGWIQQVNKSIEKRGTAGKCTPITKPGCTGRARALALTFKKMARNRKHQYGGKVYDQNGYLSSNLSKGNYTAKKVIHGKNGKTPITTNGMAFPIHANGRLLYPNTGNYIFPGNTVVETPIKAQDGYTMPPLVKPQSSNMVSGMMQTNPTGSIADIFGPSFKLPEYPYGKISDTPEAVETKKTESVSGSTELPTTGLPVTQVTGSAQVTGTGQIEKQGFNWLKAGTKANEALGIVAPVAANLAFQGKKPTKYGVFEDTTGIADQENMIKNAIPNAVKSQQDAANASMATALRAASDVGERTTTTVPSITNAVVKQSNDYLAQVTPLITSQMAQLANFERQIKDNYEQKRYQTAKQLEQELAMRRNNMMQSLGKSIENLNTYYKDYGEEGQRAADNQVLALLSKYPYFQQNAELMSILQKSNPGAYEKIMTQQSTATTTPPSVNSNTTTTTTSNKYGGLISRYGSDIKIKK